VCPIELRFDTAIEKDKEYLRKVRQTNNDMLARQRDAQTSRRAFSNPQGNRN
jgi:hypothetical protein